MRWKRTTPRLIAATLAALVASVLPISPLTQAASAAGTNLALGKTMTSSGYAQTYAPSNANDGNQATYWESTNNAFPQWLQVDLGSSTQINQVVLQIPTGWGARTETLSVQGSTDNSNFTTIVASAGYNFVRWMGGALAPYFATKLAEEVNPHLPYVVGAACCAVAIGVLVTRRRHLAPLERVDIDHTFQDEPLPAHT